MNFRIVIDINDEILKCKTTLMMNFRIVIDINDEILKCNILLMMIFYSYFFLIDKLFLQFFK